MNSATRESVLRAEVAMHHEECVSLRSSLQVKFPDHRAYSYRSREAARWKARAAQLEVQVEELASAFDRLDEHLPDDDPTRYEHSSHLRAVMDLRALVRAVKAQSSGDRG